MTVKEAAAAPRLVAIVGSPHGKGGVTYSMTEAIVGAAVAEGASAEIVHLAALKIGYCEACWACLTQGECSKDDDMTGLRRRMAEADLLVWASPTYFGSVTAQMKTFIDRLLPFGHRPSLGGKYAVVASGSAGAWETDALTYMARLLSLLGAEVVGTVGGVFAPGSFREEIVLVRDQATRVGTELVRAWRERRRYPLTGEQLHFQRFMGQLVWERREYMKEDFAYWTGRGWMNADGGAQPYMETKKLR